ncbi:hypothetical protein ACLKA6_016775 [Drosophila palustris]
MCRCRCRQTNVNKPTSGIPECRLRRLRSPPVDERSRSEPTYQCERFSERARIELSETLASIRGKSFMGTMLFSCCFCNGKASANFHWLPQQRPRKC